MLVSITKTNTHVCVFSLSADEEENGGGEDRWFTDLNPHLGQSILLLFLTIHERERERERELAR